MNNAPGNRPKIDWQYAVLTLLGAGVVAFWFWLQNARQEGAYPVFAVAVFWIIVLAWLLWLGNSFIYRLLSRRYSWEGAFRQRLVWQLLLTFLYSLACINLTYYVFKTNFTELPPDRYQFMLANIYGIFFLVPVLSIQFGLLFLQKWKRAVVEREKLEKAQVETELVTLKSHLAPHFLFNNLNILSSLIGQDNYGAQDFLDRFAEVYRYVLKNREAELIPLGEELAFLESYIFLLERRFPDSLQVQLQVMPACHRHLVPPLVLQMVLENALKHNILSEEEPLQVVVRTEKGPRLVVENNRQERAVPDREKTAFGLENIRRRYWLLARREIQIGADETIFTVQLPLISPSAP